MFKNRRLTKQEKYIKKALIDARCVQDYLWGHTNSAYDLEEFKRMFRKRVAKIDAIDNSNPHAKIELKKRVLQTAAICVNLLQKLDDNELQQQSLIPSNLPQYEKLT